MSMPGCRRVSAEPLLPCDSCAAPRPSDAMFLFQGRNLCVACRYDAEEDEEDSICELCGEYWASNDVIDGLCPDCCECNVVAPSEELQLQ